MLESNIGALWGKAQSAKGTTAVVAAAHRLTWVAGDLTNDRADGEENFSDLDRFGDTTDFVDTLIGSGSPGVQTNPEAAAWIFWAFFGQETVTGAGDPYTHTSTPGTGGGKWLTFWKRVGQNTVIREKHVDAKISQLQLQASQGQKVARLTATLMTLDPGETYTTDPTTALEAGDPFLYTEGQGTFTVDGVVLEGQSESTVVWDESLAPYYGDDVRPVDVVVGNANISVALTVLIDDEGVAQAYLKRIYGSAAPSSGTKPLRYLDPIGSYAFTLTKKTSAGAVSPARTLQVTLPGVKWAPDVAVPHNPDGGPIEVNLSGSMRKVSGQPASTVAIQNGVVAFTA